MNSNNSFILNLGAASAGVGSGLILINLSSPIVSAVVILCGLCFVIYPTLFYAESKITWILQRQAIALSVVSFHYILKSFNESYQLWLQRTDLPDARLIGWILVIVSIIIRAQFAEQKKR